MTSTAITILIINTLIISISPYLHSINSINSDFRNVGIILTSFFSNEAGFQCSNLSMK